MILSDTLAELIWNLDDREIYNDIRSQIDLSSASNPGELAGGVETPGTRTLQVPYALESGQSIELTAMVQSGVTKAIGWLGAYCNYAVHQTYGGTLANCQAMGGTFVPDVESYPLSYTGTCTLIKTNQIGVGFISKGDTSAIIRVTNNAGTTMLPYTIVIIVGYNYLAYPVRVSTDMGIQTLQVRSFDDISIRRYGRRVLNLTWPLGQTQEQMQSLVDAYLERYKEPVSKITVALKGRDDTNIVNILSGKISDRITVVNTALSLNADYFINSKEFTDSAFTPNFPTMTYQLEETRTAEGSSIFVLDTSSLDGTDILGF